MRHYVKSKFGFGLFLRANQFGVGKAIDYVQPSDQILLLDDPDKLDSPNLVKVRLRPHTHRKADGWMQSEQLQLLTPLPVIAPHHALRGLHAPADAYSWAWDEETYRIIRVAKIESVKVLCAGDIGHDIIQAVKIASGHSVNKVVARLYNSIDRDTPKSPEQWINEIGQPIIRLYEAGVRWFEFGNEVNLYPDAAPEGCGVYKDGIGWRNGTEFAAWFLQGLAHLRRIMPRDIRIGFPALSPGAAIPNFRADPQRFILEANSAVQAADWVAMHVYWGIGSTWQDALDKIAAFANHYRHKIVMVTEFSNVSSRNITSMSVKGDEYREFYAEAKRRLPANVMALHSFVLSASSAEGENQSFKNEVWRGTDIAERVGGVL